MPPFGIPSKPTLRDEGVVLPARSGGIDFIGSGVTATDDPISGRTLVTIPGGGTTNNTITFSAGSGLPVFNVKSAPYSAVGDGSADDTAKIQQAINDAQGSRGIVFFPKGNYKITSPLIITSPCTLLGEGISYGRRQSNSNWDCVGSVIWNASTTANAITYNPANAGNHTGSGLNVKSLGISTPPSSTAYAYNSTQSAGWGPFSSGTGIFIGQWGYFCIIEDCWVTRHATGIDLNNGATQTSYNAYCEVRNTVVAICRTGINATGIEQRVINSQVKCNDPEWTSSDANPARGDYGIIMNGNGSWFSRNLVIDYNYGYYADNGYGQQLADNFADACAYCYYFKGSGTGGAQTGQNTLTGNAGTACYFNVSGPTWPVGQYGIYLGPGCDNNVVTGCSIYRGSTGIYVGSNGNVISNCHVNILDSGCFAIDVANTGSLAVSSSYLYAQASNSIRFVSTGTAYMTFTGNNLGQATTGSAGASLWRGNTGKADAGSLPSGGGLNNVFDVKTYGATGDGVTDDTTSIQSALNAAQAVKGEVYFPSGTYIISSPLTITTAGINVTGAGPLQSIIKHKNTALGVTTFYVTVNGTSISHLQITSDGYKTNGWAILFENCGVVEAHHLNIANAWGGIGFIPTVGDAGTGRVYNCDIAAFKYGIQCGNANFGTPYRFIELHVDNCVIWGFRGSEQYQGEIGLYLVRTDGCFFSNMDTIGWQYGVRSFLTNCWYSNILCDSCSVGWSFETIGCSAHFLSNCYAVSTLWGTYPPSPLPYTPAVPASGATFAYDYVDSTTLTVSGGTGVSITKNGAPVTSPFTVNRGDSIVLTYSSAPTWVFTNTSTGFPAGPCGLNLEGAQGIYLDGFYCRGGDAAIKVGTGTTDIKISGARLTHVNSPGNPVRRAIHFQNHSSPGTAVTGVSNIRISDSLLYGTVCGIDWNGATATSVTITGNDVPTGMAGTAPYSTGSSRVLVKNNMGLNPPAALTPPTIPPIVGGPATVVNPFPYDCNVYISGGSGVSVTVNGISIPVTGPIRVPAGGTVQILYSGSPTWVWVGE